MTKIADSPIRCLNIGPSNPTYAIFLISVLGLFLEMMLIRWIGTEIRIFAYLQNTILVVCFLGLGLGCFASRQPVNLRYSLLPLFVLVLLLAIPVTREMLGAISIMLSVPGDLIIWEKGEVVGAYEAPKKFIMMSMGLIMTYFLMMLVLEIFVPIGQLLGRLIDDHPKTIKAYSANVAGSLVGTWLFVILSIFYQPPLTWFVVLSGLFLFFIWKSSYATRLNTALLIAIIALSWFAGREEGSLEVLWSPYQKLVLREASKNSVGAKYTINVNNVGYQTIYDLSESNTLSDPEHYPSEMQGLSRWDIPFLLYPSAQKILIVGAGSGNDVAGALRHDVRDITAVEIDPAIISLGRRYHPERPYDSPIVRLVNDDARSFFAYCKEKYDIISFGVLDAHTTTIMTNARLDHYVYTKESIERAKSLLADDGILTLRFYATRHFIADRMARVLRNVFNEEPISFMVVGGSGAYGGVMFVAGNQAVAKQQLAQNNRFALLIKKWQKENPIKLTYTTPIATDDWPYIYLKKPSVPLLYPLIAVLMFLLLIHSYQRWNTTGIFARWTYSHWHFFFLGAAFMLLEVQNISKASVVLGNTWWVNAVIISGVLVMILLANVVASKFPNLPTMPVYLFLCSTCLFLYFMDIARFAFLPYAAKATIVGSLTTLPMFLSGIVFIRSFTSVNRKDEALGANLTGALVGALLQSVSFITGIKALLLIVMGFYFLAMLSKPRISDTNAL